MFVIPPFVNLNLSRNHELYFFLKTNNRKFSSVTIFFIIFQQKFHILNLFRAAIYNYAK